MSGETIERARYRWREILPRLGIETRFLKNKNGPCPLCVGKDRYRFDDKDGSGSYYRNNRSECGPGYGVTMLMKKHGWSFATACAEIDKIIDTATPRREPSAAAVKVPGDNTRQAKRIRRALADADDPDIVRVYLTRRGLSVSSPVLRGDRDCAYYEEDEDSNRIKLVGHFPAVLAPILGPDGKLQSAHRIYDANVNSRKKMMPPIDTIKGGAVRLFDPTDKLGVGEGVETMLAVNELFDLPTWATLAAGNLECFTPPAGIRELHVFSDNDENFVGQCAAYTLARNVMRKSNRTGTEIRISVHIPDRPGTDWLDVLNERRRAAA
jgi:putative DNA primase/helicase